MNFIKLLREMVEEVLEEDLRIDKHPQAELIKKAIGDGQHLVTFSDINKVGIKPTTSYNTPAGIYGWHFSEKVLRGAKKNKIFASERKFAHLLRVKNPDKVLWLGTDKTGTSVNSPAEAVKEFVKVYPVLDEPTIQLDPQGDVDPRWVGVDDGSRKVSPIEFFLRDSEKKAQYAMTSSRQSGGTSRSEKLYDLIMATSAILEMDALGGTKKTIVANKLLRALGIEAVVDVECGGIIHNAETCHGFFTSVRGLEHIATIENRLYNTEKSAVYRILHSPNAPEDKLWEAIRALTKDFAYDLDDNDEVTGNDIPVDDALDILHTAVAGKREDGEYHGSQNLTAEMLDHIYKFAHAHLDNSIVAIALTENILSHANASTELLRSQLENAIKDGNADLLEPIAKNSEMTAEELTRIADSGQGFDHSVQVAVARHKNTPSEVLAKLAEMFYPGSAVSDPSPHSRTPTAPQKQLINGQAD